MRPLKEVLKEIEKIDAEYDKAFQLPTIEQYMERCDDLWKKKMPLIFERDSQSEPQWDTVPDFADLMTLDEFKQHCDSGGFIDLDGSGFYSDGIRESSMCAPPSMIKRGLIIKRPDFTHISWYNK